MPIVGVVQSKKQGLVHSHSSLGMEVEMNVFSLQELDKVSRDRRQSAEI